MHFFSQYEHFSTRIVNRILGTMLNFQLSKELSASFGTQDSTVSARSLACGKSACFYCTNYLKPLQKGTKAFLSIVRIRKTREHFHELDILHFFQKFRRIRLLVEGFGGLVESLGETVSEASRTENSLQGRLQEKLVTFEK